MATSDDLLQKFIEALAAEGIASDGRDGTDCLEILLIERVGRLRAARDRLIRDREAARLLPMGPSAVMARLGVSRRAVYYMAERGRKCVQAMR